MTPIFFKIWYISVNKFSGFGFPSIYLNLSQDAIDLTCRYLMERKIIQKHFYNFAQFICIIHSFFYITLINTVVVRKTFNL